MDKRTKFIWLVSTTSVAVISWFISRYMFQKNILHGNVPASLLSIGVLITVLSIITALSFLVYLGISVNTTGKPKLYGGAIFAFLLSIFCFFIPIVGQIISFYVCGRILYDIKKSNGQLRGKSLAIAGIAICVMSLIVYAVFVVHQKVR